MTQWLRRLTTDQEIGGLNPPGIEVRPLRKIWENTTRWSVRLAWWLTERVDRTASLMPHPAEVAEAFWLTAAEMSVHADLLSSNREFLDRAARGEIDLEM